MTEKIYLDLLDYAKGLYAKALQLLQPGQCDNFSVISGSLILMVGLEKLIKSIIYKMNPLMILLEKPDFDDIYKYHQGEKFENRNTISFDKALARLIQLYPKLIAYQNDMKSIILQRNLLMHNFGYLNIGDLEKKIQIKVADFTEEICKECFEDEPENIFGAEIWSKLKSNRDAYKQAEVLDLENRIRHLKRLLEHGDTLPCKGVSIPKDKYQIDIDCPVCNEIATVAFDIDWDIDVDHREGIVSGHPFPFPIALKCKCGFTLQDYEEIEIILGDKCDNIYDEVMRDFNEHE